MSAGNWTLYNKASELISKGEIDWEDDTFKMLLFGNDGSITTVTNDELGDLSGELATADGYIAGGQTIAGKSLVRTGKKTQWKSSNPQWTVDNPGTIAAWFAVLICEGTKDGLTDPLMAYLQLETVGPAAVTRVDGENFTIGCPAEGWVNLDEG